MKPNLKFRKGEFITQNSCPDSFAIFGGDAYDPVVKGAGVDYSLICYYNPSHYNQDSQGKWVRESVCEYDLDEEETCEYTINADDMQYWRSCTQEEIDNALKILAKKRLAWVEETHKFRKLALNEQLVFDNPKCTGTCGGNARRTSPMYGGSTPGIVNPNTYNYNNTNIRKTITRNINNDWVQKEPIATMDEERRIFVAGQCDKLKYAFDSYQYGAAIVYPQSGAQVPRRAAYNGYHNAMGYGMCAYNALMHGEDWWGYCD
jgi:hypothetical protein